MKITGVIKKISAIEERGKGRFRNVQIEGTVEGENKTSIYEFNIMKDRVEDFPKYYNEGDSVEATFYIDSREWKGKYYTNLTLGYTEKVIQRGSGSSSSGGGDKNQPTGNSVAGNSIAGKTIQPNEVEDDLPF